MLKRIISMTLILGLMAAPAAYGMQAAPKQSWVAWVKEKATTATSALKKTTQFMGQHKGKIIAATALLAAVAAAKYVAERNTEGAAGAVCFGPADNPGWNPYRVVADYCWDFLGCNGGGGAYTSNVCDFKLIYDFGLNQIRGSAQALARMSTGMVDHCGRYLEWVRK